MKKWIESFFPADCRGFSQIFIGGGIAGRMENGGGFIPRIGADRRRFLLVVRLLGKWRMEESFIPQISRMDADFIVGGTAMKMENGGGFVPRIDADFRGY